MVKKIILLLFLAATVMAAGSFTINWPVQSTLEVDTLQFQLPAAAVTCNSGCTEKFQVYFITSESASELNKTEHSCRENTCTFQPMFKVFRWSKWQPTIVVKALYEGSFNPDGTISGGFEALSQKVTIVRKPGTLEGLLEREGKEKVKLTFTCKEALCMGVKIFLEGHSDKAFDCKDMDKNSQPCAAEFDAPKDVATLKGVATTVIPANETFYTNSYPTGQVQQSSNICTADNCGGCLTKEECNAITKCSWWISGTPPRCILAKDNPDLPIAPPLQANTETKNIGFFEQIWEWILSLFGVN